MFPNHRKAYVNTIERLREEHGKYLDFDSAEDAFRWWCSEKSKKKYLADKNIKLIVDESIVDFVDVEDNPT